MTTIRYIHAVGNLASRRLWATCKFGTRETLAQVWANYTAGRISASDYHHFAAGCLCLG